MSLLLAVNLLNQIRITTIPAYSTACRRSMSNVHRLRNRGSRIVSAKSGTVTHAFSKFDILKDTVPTTYLLRTGYWSVHYGVTTLVRDASS